MHSKFTLFDHLMVTRVRIFLRTLVPMVRGAGTLCNLDLLIHRRLLFCKILNLFSESVSVENELDM